MRCVWVAAILVRMGARCTYIGLVGTWALVGCYQPQPSEGAPCSDDGTCPAGLSCFGGRCLAEPPPVDARSDTIDAPAGACAGVQCDGFESGNLGSWTVSRSDSALSVLVTTERVHSGTHALDASIPAQMSSGASAYVARRSAAQTTGFLATRAWFNAPQAITDFAGVLRFGNSEVYAIVTGNSNAKWTVTERSTAGLLDHASTVATVPNRWTCIELDYTFSPPRIQLYVDDALVVDLPAADPAPSFGEVGVGVTRAPTAGFRVFSDDVVIADHHVGCN